MPVLEKMAGPAVLTVIIRCIGDIEVTHELAQVAQHSLDEKMIMIFHEDITVKKYRICLQRLGQDH